MNEQLSPEDVIRLEGWITIPEAAALMRLSPNGLRKRVFEYNEFGPDNVRKIVVGANAIYLLRARAVVIAAAAEQYERTEFETSRGPAITRQKAKKQQRQEILDWAKQAGHAHKAMGRMPFALMDAYVTATGKKLIE